MDEESLTQLLQSIYNETTYFGFNLHESRLDYQLDETNVVFKTFLNKRVKKESGLTTEQLNQKLLDLENEAVSTHGIPLEVYLKSLQQHLPKSQLLFKKKSSANSQGIG